MTPNQSFNLVDRLTKALAIIDEKSRHNEGSTSYMLWNEDFLVLRAYIFHCVETLKHVEIEY